MGRTLNVKKGDLVRVVAGRDKGAEGRIIAVHADDRRVIVEGVNRVKRHTRVVQRGGRAGTTGGIVTQEAPVDVSNVMLVVDVDGQKVTTRIGYRRDEVTKTRPDGSHYTAHRSVRIARRTGKEI
ncbi:MAG: 50S ribosomal protein L24 [Nocardioidaceae bacterium]|nr:50S ribosomal protein L24 [Nocardioidaceae bacterium]MDQ3165829.1 50S ribosomal protein L24 [Actinomycetota bacterium]